MISQNKESFSNTGLKPILIDEICKIAKFHNLKYVILFGSRARGDFKERSDIDLAVSGGNITRFIFDIDENTSTLLKYDIINLDGAVQPELLESIKKEGVFIYEKI